MLLKMQAQGKHLFHIFAGFPQELSSYPRRVCLLCACVGEYLCDEELNYVAAVGTRLEFSARTR